MLANSKFTVSGMDHERTMGRRSLSRAATAQAGIIAQATILIDEMGQVNGIVRDAEFNLNTSYFA